VGRLENIIERERDRKKMTSRRVVLYAVFILTVVTIILMQCTTLGMPKAPPPAPKPPKADHVDGVLLRSH
jgi:hypothetical protein